jgi:transcriptional regulator with XRE-family HTH domain
MSSQTEPVRRTNVAGDPPGADGGIGARLRTARVEAGFTQAQLAGERYTRAYVSAIENGLARPSMTALAHFAAQLGVSPSEFLADHERQWTRLEADVALATGQWQRAIDAYEALLDGVAAPATRAELLVRRAEALCRLDRGRAAIALAAEARRLFTQLRRPADAAQATYWLAGAQYQSDNSVEARALLVDLLARLRGGMKADPTLEVRTLMALATVESRDGEHPRALAYLEEARGLAEDLDDRRRATVLFSLAYSYREMGDLEAAIRAGTQSLALFEAAGADVEVASIANDLALAYLAVGNRERAGQLSRSARDAFERLKDVRLLAHVRDTEAQVALAEGDTVRARSLAEEAIALGAATSNDTARIGALLTRARAELAAWDADAATATLQEAVDAARTNAKTGQLRQALRARAEVLAMLGRHEEAYELLVEALDVTGM